MIPFVREASWPEGARYRFVPSAMSDALDNRRAIGFVGLPDDTGVQLNGGRVGAAEGPTAFREAIARYGAACAESSSMPVVIDFGDVIVGSTIEETHQRVSEAAAAIAQAGCLPVAVGGGHDLTYAFVRGVSRATPLEGGVYLDAHLDVRPEVGSGMSFRRILDESFVKKLICVGINPMVNSDDHLNWFTGHGGSCQVFAPDAWPDLGKQFFSLDLDSIGGAFAPGVSAVHPLEGILPSQAAAYAYQAGRNPSVRCFDIMELNPRFDEGGRTALLAAHLFLAFLRGFGERS